MRGKIVKGIAGFYYVNAEDGITYACKAKGIFRKDHQKPLVGDDVEMDVVDTKDLEGSITALLPRKSALIRPAVANVDQVVIVCAGKSPDFNPHLLDRFLVLMEAIPIPVVICITKNDLIDDSIRESLRGMYKASGYPLCFVTAPDKEKPGDLAALLALLHGKVSAFAGASGVGKSTLINAIFPGAAMETGEISRKIGRGKHTTRHTELFFLGEDTYILDTPGFSSLDISHLPKQELELYFPEFSPYLGQCRFTGCAHVSEPGCRVKQAVELGEIPPERYEDYRGFYAELKDIPDYIRNKQGNQRTLIP